MDFQRQMQSHLHDLLLQTLVRHLRLSLVDVEIHRSRLGGQHLTENKFKNENASIANATKCQMHLH